MAGSKGAPLRLVSMDGTETDAKATTGMTVSVTLDAEQAAFVRVLMRERGALGAEPTVLDVFEAGMLHLSR